LQRAGFACGETFNNNDKEEEREATDGCRAQNEFPLTAAETGAITIIMATASDETFLGRPLSPDEARAALETPVESLGSRYFHFDSLHERGITTLLDLAQAHPSELTLIPRCGPAGLVWLRRALESKLLNLRRLGDIEREGPELLAMWVEGRINGLPERLRIVLEKSLGLWDGTRTTLTALAGEWGISPARAQQLREKAYAALWSEFCAGSPAFRRALRSAFLSLLRSKQGMARNGDWNDPASSFYAGQTKACLAFAAVCHAFNMVPEPLATIGMDGVCYDNITTKFRREQTIDAAKAILVDVGRSVPFDELILKISKRAGIDVTADFLRRSIELSREIGIERGGTAGMRQWDCFDAQCLSRMACASLTAIGKPATGAEIARKVEELYPWSAPVKPERACHAMTRLKGKIVSVRRGLFALAEWGLRRAPSLKDVVAGFMRTKSRALSQEIFQAAEMEGYKASSAKQFLRDHPELFRRASRGVWELAR